MAKVVIGKETVVTPVIQDGGGYLVTFVFFLSVFRLEKSMAFPDVGVL